MTFIIPNSDVVAEQCQALATLVARHTEPNGNRIYPTAIAPLSLSRSDVSSAIIYQDYQPGLALLVQGKKDMVLGKETYTYEAGQCFVVSVDLPLGRCIVEATRNRPYLGLKLTLDSMQLCGEHPNLARRPKKGKIIRELSSRIMGGAIRMLSIAEKIMAVRKYG